MILAVVFRIDSHSTRAEKGPGAAAPVSFTAVRGAVILPGLSIPRFAVFSTGVRLGVAGDLVGVLGGRRIHLMLLRLGLNGEGRVARFFGTG